MASLTMVVVLSVLSYNWLLHERLSTGFINEAAAYKNVQEWVNRNTSENSLFFVTQLPLWWKHIPSEPRSEIFGNGRMFHGAIVKTFNLTRRYETLQRISIDPYSEKYSPKEGLKQFDILLTDIRTNFIEQMPTGLKSWRENMGSILLL